MILIFPPGFRGVLTYAPPAHVVYLIFGITMGSARDFATGDTLVTDDYGFYHRGGLSDLTRKKEAMLWHFDPMVESIYLPEYPHHLICTENRPMVLEFFNNTGLTVIQDFSVWIFECSDEDWADVEQYFRGIYNLFHALGGMTTQQVASLLRRGRLP